MSPSYNVTLVAEGYEGEWKHRCSARDEQMAAEFAYRVFRLGREHIGAASITVDEVSRSGGAAAATASPSFDIET